MGQEKGLTLDFIDDPTAPAIQSDAAKLKQIFTNLISNAIKFTERGSVVVRLRHQPNEKKISVEVRDTGVGIAAENLPHLFEPYYQVLTQTEQPHKGTGLGLSIVKRLVEALGGVIHVTSQIGVGSVFTVSLPYHVPEQEPSPGFVGDQSPSRYGR